MKKLLLLFTLILYSTALAFAVSDPEDIAGVVTDNYQLVTSADQLIAGRKLVFVGEKTEGTAPDTHIVKYVMSTAPSTEKAYNFNGVDATAHFFGDYFVNNAGLNANTVQLLGNATDGWYFKTDDGNWLAATGTETANHLEAKASSFFTDENDIYRIATITFDESGVATVAFKRADRNILRLYTTSDYHQFNCYSEDNINKSIVAVAIYQQTEGRPVIKVDAPSIDFKTDVNKATLTVTQTFDGDADIKVLYTLDGQDPITKGELYEEPIYITEDCTIKAVVVVTVGEGDDALTFYSEVTAQDLTYTKPNISDPTPGTGVSDSKYYKLVTNANQLIAGRKIILIGEKDGIKYVMGNEPTAPSSRNLNGHDASQAMIFDNFYHEIDGIDANYLTLQGSSANWYFKTADGKWLTTTSDKQRYLEAKESKYFNTENDGRRKAGITVFTTGTNINLANIQFRTGTYNWLRFNKNYSYPIFNCYNDYNEQYVAIYQQTSEMPVVTAPTINFTAHTNIAEISTTQAAGSGKFEFYYTTDGTDPQKSETAQKYTGPFGLNTNCTIKAYAHYVDGNGEEYTSSVAYKTITATKLSSPTIYFEPTTSDVRIFVSYYANAGETINIYYTIDGTEPQATDEYKYTGPIVISEDCTVKAFATFTDKDAINQLISATSQEVIKYYRQVNTLPRPQYQLLADTDVRAKLTVSNIQGYLSEGYPKIVYSTDYNDPVEDGIIYEEPFAVNWNGLICTRTLVMYDGDPTLYYSPMEQYTVQEPGAPDVYIDGIDICYYGLYNKGQTINIKKPRGASESYGIIYKLYSANNPEKVYDEGTSYQNVSYQLMDEDDYILTVKGFIGDLYTSYDNQIPFNVQGYKLIMRIYHAYGNQEYTDHALSHYYDYYTDTEFYYIDIPELSNEFRIMSACGTFDLGADPSKIVWRVFDNPNNPQYQDPGKQNAPARRAGEFTPPRLSEYYVTISGNSSDGEDHDLVQGSQYNFSTHTEMVMQKHEGVNLSFTLDPDSESDVRGTMKVYSSGAIVTGVESITVDENVNDCEVEYYNLQGVRVANPQPGTVVIKRQGNKTAKILVR